MANLKKTKKKIEWFQEGDHLQKRHLLEMYRWYRANKQRCFRAPIYGDCAKCPIGLFKNCNCISEEELITVFTYRDKTLDWDWHKDDCV